MARKKNSFKVMAEALACGGLKALSMPISRVKHRKLTIDEIKDFVLEEFGKVKDAADEEIQEPEKGWQDAELENHIEWVKSLNLKEAMSVFGRKAKRKLRK